MKQCPTCRNSYPDDYQTCPRDQSFLTAAPGEIAVGTVLRGKYEILAELGAGGMATVYKVRHKAFQELAAVKVVHPHFMHDPDFVKRFRNEAIVARQLKHPNAVRIDDFDYSEDGRPFIVMEYVEGHTLYDIRKRYGGAWPVERCLNIGRQAASALAAAHALGIVHRDIKPSNILLLRGSDGEAQVKLLDFGIAKVGDRSFAGMTSVMTSQSVIIGTPEYMSPEQARGGMEGEIDGRADLYSLGLVIYEFLTGAHPFKSDTPMGMLMHQLGTPPPPPESFAIEVSPAVSALLLKSLAKDRADRFQSAAEMLEALNDPERWYAARNSVEEEPEEPASAPLQVAPPPTQPPPPVKTPKAPTVIAAPPPTEAAAAVLPKRKAPTVFASGPPKPASAAPAPATLAAAGEPPPRKDPTVFAARTPAPQQPETQPQAVVQVVSPQELHTRKSPLPLIAAAIILLAVLAGAAFFFLRRQQQPAAVVAAPVVPAATVAPPPTPSTTTAPPAAVDPETSAKVAKLIGSGNRALARGDADIAAEFFDQALSLDPTSAEAQAGLRKARKP